MAGQSFLPGVLARPASVGLLLSEVNNNNSYTRKKVADVCLHVDDRLTLFCLVR